MKKPEQELPANPEQNLEKLKESLLELIAQYNQDSDHRTIELINNFGEPVGYLWLYWANWHDDNRSTHTIGFTYNNQDNTLASVAGQKDISFDKASEYFAKELEAIPKK